MLSKESYPNASSASKPKLEWINTVLASNNDQIGSRSLIQLNHPHSLPGQGRERDGPAWAKAGFHYHAAIP